jgi:integrase/recombinase XerD
MVAADVPERGRIYYLVDDQCDFIPEAKEFFDWNAATNRAPTTIKAYCSRLLWYYRFLWQHNLCILDATPADLTEFVIWLCNPYRESASVSPIHQASLLAAPSVNLILQVVGAFYHFLVRRGKISESPVRYVDVPRGKWLTERDLLAHTHRGRAVVQRMELKLKEPSRLPPTVSEQDFQMFIDNIHMGQDPNGDPPGFRDRLLCLMLKEGGFRIGELLWWLLEVSAQNLEGLISSVTSYFETTHSNAIRFGESLALPSAKHGHHEAQSLLVGCILRRKTAGLYLLLILNRR